MEENEQRAQGTASETEGAAELNALLHNDARLQSQFDRLVTKALGTARTNWEREQAERDAQTARTHASQRERTLEEREQALRQRELRADAATLLSQRGLPQELLECVSLGDADGLDASVGKVERAFRASVDNALRTRMAGAPPKSGGAAVLPDAQLRRAMGLKTD